MSEEHRKALPYEAIISAMADTWAERTGIVEKLKTLPSNLPTPEMRARHDELVLRHVKLSYEEGVDAGWQACAAHYAPKLSDNQSAERLARFFALQEYHAHGFETLGSPETYMDEAWKDHIANAKAALRAAGVRFKDEP